MAAVKTVRRGMAKYFYLVQTYRWDGAIRKKQEYLGTSIPRDLQSRRNAIEHQVLTDTYFRDFDRIRERYQARLKQLPNSVAEKERSDFIVEFTYDTNRIEGSTLSLDDTRRLLERGISPSAKPVRDIVETRRHAELVGQLIEEPEPVDLPHLLKWHRDLFSETKPDIAGRIRDFEVRISGSKHTPPPALEVRPMLVELLRSTSRAVGREHQVELAADFHFKFENIHPFGDGNGRIGRLAMNVLLARGGYPMLNIEYKGRRGYYKALEKCSVLNDPRPFSHWFFLRYRRSNRLYLRSGSKE